MTRKLFSGDGEAEFLGVHPQGDGVNVAVFSAHAAAIEFCLFENDCEVRRVRLRGRTGDVFHDHISGIPLGARYGLRAHGPFLPREGHWFNPSKLLVDPYVTLIDRPFVLHKSMFGHRGDESLSMDDTDSAPFMPKGIVQACGAPATMVPQLCPWSRTVLYELHVRGFTMKHPDIPQAMRGRFAGLAHPKAIEHLQRLGITSVEIMPAAAWIDERHLVPLGLRNYWGYNPVALMAPDPGLAPGGWDEIRAAVAALAEAGIETILDVVLNHTGEGDILGPTVSLRGLDNATYYRLTSDAPRNYVNDTGCGNMLALDQPAVMRLAMDALRTWVSRAGVHGFRFDLATTLGRRPDGFDPAAPLLSAIAQDPVLCRAKLIAEPWDIGPGGYQLGAFPGAWGEWNDRYRDDIRRFWRGDSGQLGPLATRLAGSSDLFAAKRLASRSINFITAHDGFTLADLVSYERKHNAANGEDNRDGTHDNLSWNNGHEGATDDPAVIAARRRDQRALLATLLLSRGTPMLAMGAELGHSQGGNNNAYAQDNETAWLNWARADEGLIAWTSRLIRIRRDHEVFRADRFLTGAPIEAGMPPDVAWHDATGAEMERNAWDDPNRVTLVMILAGADPATTRAAMILHRGLESVPVMLPPARSGHIWRLLADSAEDEAAERDVTETAITVKARSVIAVVEQPRKRGERSPAGGDLIGRLAKAAGIAPEWWDLAGKRTIVSHDTRLALLAAMGHGVGSDGEARDSLRQIGFQRDRREVPASLVVRGEGAATLSMGLEPGLSRRPIWLTIEKEDGETQQVRIRADDGVLISFIGADGMPAQSWNVPLPHLPMGRHRLWRDDAMDAVCHVTIAPHGCFLPDSMLHGERLFGISAQLYALRRQGDQGIGDFTTLARLAEAAGQVGAATVGINPLHMLFASQRERASPYHPSDRRFLDPIYIDLGESVSSAGEFVEWSGVWSRKQAALERRFGAMPADEKDAFQRFISAGGAVLRRFATFQAIAETRPGEVWHHWPEELRSPQHPTVEAFARAHETRVRYHQYAQFLADRQFGAAAAIAQKAGLELGFYRDLAVGAAPDGAESWARTGELARGAWIGAPPDPLAPQGQNWFLPPPIPSRMADDGYASFAALLAANMRHAGALRIDHVLGLSRLFWIPDGGSGADGAYVSYPLADLIGQVALESMRARCLVVGEDLGTVPDGLRPQLTDANILGYRVLLMEREGRAFRPPASYPARAVACVTTHDIPPLAGWWEGIDQRERADLGLLPEGFDAAGERAGDRAALAQALTGSGYDASADSSSETVVRQSHGFVAATPCDLMLVQTDDLAGARIGVNLPGTDTERPNWRRRLEVPVESILTTDTARSILESVKDGRSKRKK